MLAVHPTLAAALAAPGATPVWYVEIDKSEGDVDPNGNTSVWPGTGEAQTRRIFSTGRVGWTTRAALLAAGTLHEDRLGGKGIGDIVRKLQNATRAPGGLAGTDTVEIRIDNTDAGLIGNPVPLSPWFAPNPALGQVSVAFGGRRVKIYLTAASVTNRNYSLLVFTGTVNDPQTPGDQIRLVCESDVMAWDTDVPPRIFTIDEITDAGVLPPSTIGKPIPMVFGAHDMAPGYVTADVIDGGTNDTGRRVVFADVDQLPIKLITEMRFGDPALIKATGGFASIKSAAAPNLPVTSTFTVDASIGAAYFDDPEDEDLRLYIDVSATSPARHITGFPGTNPELAVDRDEATSAGLDIDVPAERHLVLAYKIPAISLGGTIETAPLVTGFSYIGIFGLCRARIVASHTDGTRSAYFWARLQNYALDMADPPQKIFAGYMGQAGPYSVDQTVDYYSPRTPDTDCMFEVDNDSLSEWSALSQVGGRFISWQIFYESQTLNCDVYLYEFLLRIYFSMETPDEGYYASLEGYKDRDALITGVANQLIEHPVDIAYALLCYWTPSHRVIGGYGVYPIDATSQAIVRAARPGYKFARALTDREKFSNLVDQLGWEAQVWFHVDANGRFAAIPWDTSAEPVITLTPSMVEGGEVGTPEQSRIEDVVTEFEFRWKENTVRNEFDETLFCSATDSSTGLGAEFESLCAWASFDNGGVRRKETYDFYWIRDRATAIEAAKRLIRFHTARRWQFPAELDLEMVGVQIGDRIDLSPLAAWPRSWHPSMIAAKYRVYEAKHSSEKNRVSIKATQVFE